MIGQAAGLTLDQQLLLELLDPQLVIVVVALWILGFMLKKSDVRDKWIIWILLVVSIAVTMGILGVSILAGLQGVIAAAIAGYAHQLLKQTTKKE